MKKISVLLLFVLILARYAHAEKIYCIDGSVIDADVLYLNRGTLWIKSEMGSMGISLDRIERIDNDDGTISKFDFHSLLSKGQALLGQRRYPEALKLYEVLLESFPEDTRLHYLRALLSHRSGNLQEALQDYRFLVRHDAADASVFNNGGAILAGIKDYNEALVWFRKAVAASPGLGEAHNNLAQLLLELKRYDEAIAEFLKVIEIEPNNADALYNLGVAYLNQGDAQKAREQWEKVLIFRPDDSAALANLKYFSGQEAAPAGAKN